MRRFTQSGRRRTLAEATSLFAGTVPVIVFSCISFLPPGSTVAAIRKSWFLNYVRRPFFYRSDRNNRLRRSRNEEGIERNVIRLVFIGILCRNFKLIVATIVGDYRTGGTLIILSLLISLKMLARCCLRIASHGGTGLNIKCLEISVALFCLILQST